MARARVGVRGARLEHEHAARERLEAAARERDLRRDRVEGRECGACDDRARAVAAREGAARGLLQREVARQRAREVQRREEAVPRDGGKHEGVDRLPHAHWHRNARTCAAFKGACVGCCDAGMVDFTMVMCGWGNEKGEANAWTCKT